MARRMALAAADVRRRPSLARARPAVRGWLGLDAGSSLEKEPEAGPEVITLREVGAGPSNLPVSLTSFVGREDELAELREALGATRMLTLTGPGGCGKTRLALEVARDSLDRFPGGVWWVELAALSDERLVGPAVAEALGVRPPPGITDLQAACRYLVRERSLVVLDNCERMLDVCAHAAEALVQAAPEAVVLATSRAPLGAAGETTWRVPALAESDAVSLFVERARDVRPGFELNDANAASVVGVCVELDGQPLAIELATARLRMLTVEQIDSGLSDRFRLLTGGPRTASARQQTLRASMDWSHDLLTPDEQALLRRVAVFSDGFTLDAAQRVCANDETTRDAVLDVLGSLVDQSLVTAEHSGPEARYGLLETVRQYGLEKLAEAGEEDPLRGRHCAVFLALAEEAAPHLETGRFRKWLERLDPEAANLSAAVDHALSTDPPVAIRLCTLLCRWWVSRARIAEAELAFARALDAGEHGGVELRARAFESRAFLASRVGNLTTADAYATEALALAEAAGDKRTAARARCQLGWSLARMNPGAARVELSRAADLASSAGDDWAYVLAKQNIAGSFVFQSDHPGAQAALDEVGPIAQEIGDPVLVGAHWLLTAVLAYTDGRHNDARDAAHRQRASGDGFDEVLSAATAATSLAFADAWQGQGDRALELVTTQLNNVQRLGAVTVIPRLMLAGAIAELATGRVEQARDRLDQLVPRVQDRDLYSTAWALALLASALAILGEETAEATALRAQAAGEKLGNRLVAGAACLSLGRVAATRGDYVGAQTHALAALDACAEGGHMTFLPSCLDALAEAAAGVRARTDAVRLFAAAERARADVGAVRIPPEAEHWSAIDNDLREAMGDEAYETARAGGAALKTDEAVAWVRRTRGSRGRPPGGWDSLTPTETMVAELASEGLTNRQIGERMFISPETVKTHVAHIFRKLDVHNRTELGALAARRSTTS
jgi:predicted ATPase/DNA-binding CsgD family transcriptional regulator